jgi:hypothetical protein
VIDNSLSMDAKKPFLVIPDLQIPYENPKALKFCAYLKKHYKVPDENVLNAGDESDQFHGSSYDKDPDEPLSPVDEISITRERFKEWAGVFPIMKLAISNHGLRWLRKAVGAQIPSQVIRSYQDLFQTPPGWSWREEWRFSQLRHPFRMIHGMGYSGVNAHRNAVMDSGMSTVIGHLHSYAAVSHIQMLGGERMWGMNAGCLINPGAIAFKYGKYNRPQPILGAGLIFNEGAAPIFIPLE